MTATDQAAQAFAQRWEGKGYEKGQSQLFWTELLTDVLGVETPSEVISFEDRVRLDHTSFIDAYIERTHVMIEQKSLGKDLSKPIRQSDGTLLTPFEQAKRYAAELPYSKRPRWIVTCNFSHFLIHDMERPQGDPVEIALSDLPRERHRLRFLTDGGAALLQRETEVSMKAGELVGRIYDLLIRQYLDPTAPATLQSLNVLCVRLVFCLYAEDAGVFGRHNMFHDYLEPFPPGKMRKALMDLFATLDTPPAERDPYLEPELAAFPYTNGGLFARRDVEIPNFTPELKTLLLRHASLDFDWSEISPTIFGGVFESTLNPETRRSGGMHYTSIENIHKAIDPLFLTALTQELERALAEPVAKCRVQLLRGFQDRLAGLTFLDPACGSGNFLTETYLSLRRLENRVIQALYGVRTLDAFQNPIKVSIGQFHGIEVNDFAVTVATTALWISEAQMMAETERIIKHDIDFLPLKSYANIHEGNALRTDWADVVPPGRLNFIIGNPPFVGFTYMSASQKADMAAIFPGVKNLDYVCAWYKKAADLMRGTAIETAFVSTNSIVQGETAARFWPFMQGCTITFAHRSFVWESEASQKAHVHCVVIGLAGTDAKPKRIFDGDRIVNASHINGYLLDGSDTLVTSRNKPLCDVPRMVNGNKPADGGHLIIEDADLEEFLRRDPQSREFIHPLVGAQEFINGKRRWCLWLADAPTAKLARCPLVMERIRLCKESRQASIAAAIRKFADTPTLFVQCTQPVDEDFIIVPSVSSEKREYVPMGFVKAGTIATNTQRGGCGPSACRRPSRRYRGARPGWRGKTPPRWPARCRAPFGREATFGCPSCL